MRHDPHALHLYSTDLQKNIETSKSVFLVESISHNCSLPDVHKHMFDGSTMQCCMTPNPYISVLYFNYFLIPFFIEEIKENL